MIARFFHWLGAVGEDVPLARAQLERLHKQVPLLYGLLLINSVGIAAAHWGKAPMLLTLSIPALLFGATLVRMVHWLRSQPPTEPAAIRASLQRLVRLATIFGIGYVSWALSLTNYGGPFEQSHVALYISTTVIGCIFCLIHLPQAAVMVAICVFPPFLLTFVTKDQGAFAPIALNISLVAAVLLRVLFNGFDIFRRECGTRAELARLNAENRSLAHTDALTGLRNRRSFYDDLAHAAARVDGGAAVTVGLIDLDRFKPVNDSFGHHVGDQLLAEIAHRLSVTTGEAATLYRIGGDEFAMIVDAGDVASQRLAARMCAAVAAPVQIGDRQVSVGASIGLAPLGSGVASAEYAERADHALYHAKRVCPGQAVLFSPEIEGRVRRDHLIEVELQAPGFETELQVEVQPIVSTRAGQVIGGELLARWNSARLGTVDPQRFIDVAERSALIHRITRSVVARALDLLERLPRGHSLSVNVSACDLRSAETVDAIIDMVRRSRADPSRLCIEVTETAVMRDLEAAIDALARFRAIGMEVALDDFGTGYSSLSNLHRLPLDKVKIDRSFAVDLDNAYSISIIKAVVGLCESLGLVCIAEGVETYAQARKLQAIGCNLMQGYLFGRPAAPGAFVAGLGAPLTPSESPASRVA